MSEEKPSPKKRGPKPGTKRKFAGPNPKSGFKEAEKLSVEEVASAKASGVRTPRADRYADCNGFVWMTIHHNPSIQMLDLTGKNLETVWVPVLGGDKIDMKIKVGSRVCVPRDVATILQAANDVEHPGYDPDLAMQELRSGMGMGMGRTIVKKIRWPYTIEREATPEEFEEFASGKKLR